VSIALPPPIAITQSQFLLLHNFEPSLTISAGGSGSTLSNSMYSIPQADKLSNILSIIPAALTPESNTKKAFLYPASFISSPICIDVPQC